MTKKKATGRQGWWFAEVDGVALPCVHKHWAKGTLYHDPFERHEVKGLEKKIAEAVSEIIRQRKVVMTDDHVSFDPKGNVIGFERKNYIAVFAIDDVNYSKDDGLRFRLLERLYSLE